MLTLTVLPLSAINTQRTVYATVLARVDYELTDLGRTPLVPLATLSDWPARIVKTFVRREPRPRVPMICSPL
jgi:DNA-binding HxlR family transcriptional regulator